VCGEANPHGLRLTSRVESGSVVIRYTPRDADRGWRRIVHGGIAMTLLDEVMTWAAILHTRRACVAAELSVRLRKPIEVGRPLRIIGNVTGGRPRLVLAEGTILDESDTVLFSATGKYVPMDRETEQHCADDFVAGPDTIPLDRIFG